MDAGPLEEVEIDADDDSQQQTDEADGQQRDGALQVELAHISVRLFVELVEVVALAHHLVVLHQQHICILVGDEG